MCVSLMCIFALEVPLKQASGGGWVDLSLQKGDCDVAVENGGGLTV